MNQTQSAPIILVHGLFGFNQVTFGGLKVAEYFRSIPEALRRDGHSVPEPPQLNPGGSGCDPKASRRFKRATLDSVSSMLKAALNTSRCLSLSFINIVMAFFSV